MDFCAANMCDDPYFFSVYDMVSSRLACLKFFCRRPPAGGFSKSFVDQHQHQHHPRDARPRRGSPLPRLVRRYGDARRLPGLPRDRQGLHFVHARQEGHAALKTEEHCVVPFWKEAMISHDEISCQSRFNILMIPPWCSAPCIVCARVCVYKYVCARARVCVCG